MGMFTQQHTSIKGVPIICIVQHLSQEPYTRNRSGLSQILFCQWEANMYVIHALQVT